MPKLKSPVADETPPVEYTESVKLLSNIDRVLLDIRAQGAKQLEQNETVISLLESMKPSGSDAAVILTLDELKHQIKVLGDDIVASAALQARGAAKEKPSKAAPKERATEIAAEQSATDKARLEAASVSVATQGMHTEVHDPFLKKLAAEKAAQTPKETTTAAPAPVAVAAAVPPDLSAEKLTQAFLTWGAAHGTEAALELLKLSGAEKLSKVDKSKWGVLWGLLQLPPPAKRDQPALKAVSVDLP